MRLRAVSLKAGLAGAGSGAVHWPDGRTRAGPPDPRGSLPAPVRYRRDRDDHDRRCWPGEGGDHHRQAPDLRAGRWCWSRPAPVKAPLSVFTAVTVATAAPDAAPDVLPGRLAGPAGQVRP
jgi:hypothetical protein